MILEDNDIERSEEYLASALNTDKNGASILDIPQALDNNYLGHIAAVAEKDISLSDLLQKIENGNKAIVSMYLDEFDSAHAVIVDEVQGGKIIIRKRKEGDYLFLVRVWVLEESKASLCLYPLFSF